MPSNILIYGRGKVGQSLARFCESISQEYVICDDSDAPEDFQGFSYIVPSPGVPQSHRVYASGKVLSEIDFLSKYIPKDFQIHAVTGTDGKSTTSWILYHFLKESFIDAPVYLGGNFGTPLADIVMDIMSKNQKNGHIVLEVSSFMAYHLEAFPFSHTTILTNLHPDHLDWHGDVENYYRSKINLLGRTRHLILYPESLLSQFPEVRDFPLQSIILPSQLEIVDSLITLAPGIMLDISDRQLFGYHNYCDIFFAASVALSLGISVTTLSRILPTISALPHRLQQVSSHGRKIWIDDSKSTTAQALYAALGAFSPQKIHLIAGGKNKGDPFDGLVARLAENCVQVVALGETAHTFLQAAHEAFVPAITVSDMDEAVRYLSENTKDGDIILLSPGCSSLDMYTNYEERAQIFIDAIHGLE